MYYGILHWPMCNPVTTSEEKLVDNLKAFFSFADEVTLQSSL